MQATVRRFDPGTRSGTVLLDDGAELAYDSTAFDVSGLRLLRVGQRVRIEVAESPDGRTVRLLTIPNLPEPHH